MSTIIETPRLALREMTPADLDFVAEMLADPDVMHHYPKRHSREEAGRWLERQRTRYVEDGYGLWLVVRRTTGEPIGQVGLLRQQVDGVHEFEVGYLIHRPHWRQGFATEAALATRDHAFKTLRKTRVISLIRPENEPSQGVAVKLGMSIERQTLWAGVLHLVFAVRRPEGPA